MYSFCQNFIVEKSLRYNFLFACKTCLKGVAVNIKTAQENEREHKHKEREKKKKNKQRKGKQS